MSVKEAAKYLGISTARVYQLISAGKIRIENGMPTRESVERYLETRKNGRPVGSFKKRG
jgi:predicted DNA-binding transcriptional regulator AlpA